MIKDYTEIYVDVPKKDTMTIKGSYEGCMEQLRKVLDEQDCIFVNVTFNIEGWEI